jgi:hypothetical protein
MEEFKLRGDESLAELRTINARLNSERTAASHALTAEKTERINEYNKYQEKNELDYEELKFEKLDAYNVEKALLDKKYCELGVEVGLEKDRRRLAETIEEVEEHDNRIRLLMNERHNIKVRKAGILGRLNQELHELKANYLKTKRELGAQRDTELQSFVPRRQECNDYYDAAVEITRRAIAKLISAERAAE